MDLAEDQNNIYGNWTRSGGQVGSNPRNELNNLYGEMTSTYNAIRDINQVTTVFSPISGDFYAGQDFEKIQDHGRSVGYGRGTAR